MALAPNQAVDLAMRAARKAKADGGETAPPSVQLAKNRPSFKPVLVHGGRDFDDLDFSKLGSGEPGGIRPLGRGFYGGLARQQSEIETALNLAKTYAGKYGGHLHAFELNDPAPEKTSMLGYGPNTEWWGRAGGGPEVGDRRPGGGQHRAWEAEALPLGEFGKPGPQRIEMAVHDPGLLSRLGKWHAGEDPAKIVADIQKAQHEAGRAAFLKGNHPLVPDVVYHGTNRDIRRFDLGAKRRVDAGMGEDQTDTGWYGKGIYLTPHRNAASGYAGGNRTTAEEGANVMPLHVAMKNPFIVKRHGGTMMDRYLNAAGAPPPANGRDRLPSEQTAWLKSQGHDGVVAYDETDPGAGKEIVAFHPNQIKSAIGNRGTFDPGTPDITKAAGGRIARGKGGGSGRAVTFEVAPGKTWDAKQQARWEALHPSVKSDITGRMVDEFMPRWMRDTGISGDLKPGLGGFEGATNPNFAFEPHDPSRLAEAANRMGHLFRQDSMMAAHEHPFPGSTPSGVARVHLPIGMAPEEIHSVYKTLHDQGLAYGHSTNPATGHMDITLFGANKDETAEHAKKVDQALGGKYDVAPAETHVAFPQHGEDYGGSTVHPAGAGSPASQADDSVQQQARTRLQRLLNEAHRQGGGHQGPVNLDPKPYRQTVDSPVGIRYPGIYGNPREQAAEAASRVAPESPWLKRLWGVNRADMYERGAHRVGTIEPTMPYGPGRKVNYAAGGLMTRRNAQRLQDILHEGSQHEGLRHGMMAWYYMDPVFDRLHQIVGGQEAVRRYRQMNALTGMHSPGAEVPTELKRGLAADYAAEHGLLDEYIRHGGTPESKRGEDFPEWLRPAPGHMYHSTSHTTPLRGYLERGDLSGMQSVKVPTYIPASGVPGAGGFQTNWPVPDAHYTRGIGMADTRKTADPGASMSPEEYRDVAPWWRENVAKPLGMQSVPSQGLAWGTMSGATGVTSPIGAPKLELLTNHVMDVAQRHGIAPEAARDAVIKGDIYAQGGRVARAEGGEVEERRDTPIDPDAVMAKAYADKTEQVPLDWLEKLPGNELRHGDDYIDAMANQLATKGAWDPAIINVGKHSRTAELGEGNHRIEAARRAGFTHFPARVITGSEWGKDKPGSDYHDDLIPQPDEYFSSDARPSQVFRSLAPGKAAGGPVDPDQPHPAQQLVNDLYAEHPPWPYGRDREFVIPHEMDENGQASKFSRMAVSPAGRQNINLDWISSYPMRQGLGGQALGMLKDRADAAGVGIKGSAWAKGQIPKAKLIKFYRKQGFDVTPSGQMSWSPTPRPAKAEGGPLLFHSNLHGGEHPPSPHGGGRVHRMHVGPIHSPVAGRTDHLPMHVPSGSYVLPADVVSAHGEGNTSAGFKVMRRLFGGAPYGHKGGPYGQSGAPYNQTGGPYGQSSGPYGEPLQNQSRGGRATDGERDKGVPIVAAGGEYVLSPDQVRAAGKGDPDLGCRVLDEFVKRSRAKHIKTLRGLPGPAKD